MSSLTIKDFELLHHMLASRNFDGPRTRKIKIFRNHFSEETNHIRDYVKDAFDKGLIRKGRTYNNGESIMFHVSKKGHKEFKSACLVLGYTLIENKEIVFLDANEIEVS